MRILAACSLGGAGHLQPLLPFLAAARRQGHEARVICPPSRREVVERAGCEFAAGAEPDESDVAPIREQLPVAPPVDEEKPAAAKWTKSGWGRSGGASSRKRKK